MSPLASTNFSKNLTTISFYLLLILLAVLPFSAFLTTWIRFGLGFDSAIPINIWKDVLVLMVVGLGFLNWIRGYVRIKLDLLSWLVLTFIGLSILSGIFQTADFAKVGYGFKYSVEFFILFLAVRHFFVWTPVQIDTLVKAAMGSGIVVILFSLLQAFVLPHNFLTHFGYSTNISSWVAGEPLPMYHRVSEADNLIRLQSTLSGPNQFATYLLILLPLLALKLRSLVSPPQRWLTYVAAGFGLISLTLTFSRSAYLGIIVGTLAGVIAFVHNPKYRIPLLTILLLGIGLAVTLVVSIPGLYEQIVIRQASSTGHYKEAINAFGLIIAHPLGYGIGNAGPATHLLSDSTSLGIPESWYLQTAIELGLIGLVLFVLILMLTLKNFYIAYKKIHDPIYASLAISLVAIGVSSLFLHSWEESAVALSFWALAGATLRQSTSSSSPTHRPS